MPATAAVMQNIRNIPKGIQLLHFELTIREG